MSFGQCDFWAIPTVFRFDLGIVASGSDPEKCFEAGRAFAWRSSRTVRQGAVVRGWWWRHGHRAEPLVSPSLQWRDRACNGSRAAHQPRRARPWASRMCSPTGIDYSATLAARTTHLWGQCIV